MVVGGGDWHMVVFGGNVLWEIGGLWLEGCQGVAHGRTLMLNCLIMYQSWEADLSRQSFPP